MRKFLSILLLFFSTPSFADWDLVASAADNTSDHYIDLDQIRKEGGFIHFWTLTDLKIPDGDGDLSYVNFVLGDCELFRIMYLTGYYYKKNMVKGILTGSTYGQTAEWSSPETGTIDEVLLNKVCDS